jgi:UDP-N-acetylmuramyl tripeptide synthase
VNRAPFSIRSRIAIAVGKTVAYATRVLGLGGGTAAPGLYALKFDKNLLASYARTFTNGSIIITGTNGKTTTARIISHYFSQNKISFIHNRAGSNLERGIISACLEHTSYSGQLTPTSYGLWEIDEAEFSRSLGKIKPRMVVLLNLFRDQLDRYGEVDTTRRRWAEALLQLPQEAEIIYNSDDPQLTELVETFAKIRPDVQSHAYSVEGQKAQSENSLFDPLNLVLCPHCNILLTFATKTITGQGLFHCTQCGLQNKIGEVHTKNITLSSNESSSVIAYNGAEYSSTIKLVGYFNLYNVAAATTLLLALGYDVYTVLSSAHEVMGAFGRMEKIEVEKRTVILSLIKNPTGAKESLRTIFHENFHNQAIVFILNDNYADGQDVSWIWDVPWEQFCAQLHGKVYVAGSRCYDMATRLQYAGIKPQQITVYQDFNKLIDKIIDETAAGSQIPFFATYTAMLDLQAIFARRGFKQKYWEE